MHAIDYSEKLRDTNTERELAKNLREMSDEERFAFITEMLDVHLIVALDLANSCLKKREMMERLLEQGMARSKDISDPRVWIEKLLPKVGFKRTLAILKKNLDAYPIAVAGGLYYLLRFVGKEDEGSSKAFDDLFEETKKKGEEIPALQRFFDQLGSRN